VTVLGSCALVAFVAATALGRARAFYERVLGLPLRHEDAFACVFDAAGTTLRITAVRDHRPSGATVLGWSVPDIERTVQALRAAGVELLRFEGIGQDGAGVWTAPGGDRVAWFHDPDGNTLSVTAMTAATTAR
jgi:catechol 2,3-dioxygenase-like lactoylglutathione lyase family enzyme